MCTRLPLPHVRGGFPTRRCSCSSAPLFFAPWSELRELMLCELWQTPLLEGQRGGPAEDAWAPACPACGCVTPGSSPNLSELETEVVAAEAVGQPGRLPSVSGSLGLVFVLPHHP